MDTVIRTKIDEIIRGYDGDPELLWSYILTSFSAYENEIKHKYDRNLVTSLAKPIYFRYVEMSKDRYRIRYLVKKMEEQTWHLHKPYLKLRHPNANEIYKHDRNIVLNSLYELMDEYPITCLVLSGEFIKHGLIPNVYKEENRGNIKFMCNEFKTWYDGQRRTGKSIY